MRRIMTFEAHDSRLYTEVAPALMTAQCESSPVSFRGTVGQAEKVAVRSDMALIRDMGMDCKPMIMHTPPSDFMPGKLARRIADMLESEAGVPISRPWEPWGHGWVPTTSQRAMAVKSAVAMVRVGYDLPDKPLLYVSVTSDASLRRLIAAEDLMLAYLSISFRQPANGAFGKVVVWMLQDDWFHFYIGNPAALAAAGAPPRLAETDRDGCPSEQSRMFKCDGLLGLTECVRELSSFAAQPRDVQLSGTPSSRDRDENEVDPG